MTLFKSVGREEPSLHGKTYKVMYDLEELLRIADKFRNSRKEFVFLGLIRRREMYNSLRAFPSFPIEISQFVNYLSPERRRPAEILNAIPLADVAILEKKELKTFE